MKASQALHIAEHLWEDTVQPNSLFDMMMKKAPRLEELRLAGKAKEINAEVVEIRSEIVARWANIITEVEGHSYED